jgi:hypothetical protein
MGLFNNLFKKKGSAEMEGVPREENLDPPPLPGLPSGSVRNDLGSNEFFAKNRMSYDAKDPYQPGSNPNAGSTAIGSIPQSAPEKSLRPETQNFSPDNKDDKKLADMFNELKSKNAAESSGIFSDLKFPESGLDRELLPSQKEKSESKEVHDEVSGLTLPPLYPTNDSSGFLADKNPHDIESIKPFEKAPEDANKEKTEKLSPENQKAISSTVAYAQLKNAPPKANTVDIAAEFNESDLNLWQKPYLNVVDFNNIMNTINSVIAESKIAGEAISRIEGINHEMEQQYGDWQKNIEDFENSIVKLDNLIYKEKEIGD